MKFVVVIPARYASSRLPGKPLREILGKPLIQYVYECAQKSTTERVIIATDDERIRRAAERFGAEVCMTSTEHRSGTDRLAEVVEKLALPDEQILVNVQGDEPMIPPGLICQVAEDLCFHQQADVATLCQPIHNGAELFNPNITKVVMNKDGYAQYFSRAPIPWDRSAFPDKPAQLAENSHYHRHIGLYAYRTAFLKEYVCWPSCYLEETECLEQLRVLWNGGRIHVVPAIEEPGPGVDTEEDLLQVERLLSAI